MLFWAGTAYLLLLTEHPTWVEMTAQYGIPDNTARQRCSAAHPPRFSAQYKQRPAHPRSRGARSHAPWTATSSTPTTRGSPRDWLTEEAAAQSRGGLRPLCACAGGLNPRRPVGSGLVGVGVRLLLTWSWRLARGASPGGGGQGQLRAAVGGLGRRGGRSPGPVCSPHPGPLRPTVPPRPSPAPSAAPPLPLLSASCGPPAADWLPLPPPRCEVGACLACSTPTARSGCPGLVLAAFAMPLSLSALVGCLKPRYRATKGTTRWIPGTGQCSCACSRGLGLKTTALACR